MSDNSLLKTDDFKNFEFSVFLVNTTTQTQLVDSNKVQISEFLKNGIVLRVPKNTCSVGHSLMVYLIESSKSPRVLKRIPSDGVPGAMVLTAKVNEVESLSKDQNQEVFITLELMQFVEKEWKNLIGQFEAVQGRVSETLNKLKG
jgi:hypothetical protein